MTLAGDVLLAHLAQWPQCLATHGDRMVAAIEAEAVAARNAEIAAAVRGLPLRGVFGEGPGAKVIGRAAVLEIIEKP